MNALRRQALVVSKLAVSFAFLAYLFSTTDLEALLARVRTGDLLYLVGATLLYAAMLAVATWRWRRLLKALGFRTSLRSLSASYLVATFFNNFLPSNIGGDFVRVRDGSRLTGSTTMSLAVVAIDRILGFGALYLIALAAFTWGGPVVRNLIGARPVLLLLSAVFGTMAYLFFRPGMARTLMSWTGLSRVTSLHKRFETVQQAVHVYRRRLLDVWLSFGASIVLQALVVCYFYVVALALHIEVPLMVCFLIVPICTLVQAIPISFNGWGVRESVFILYFAQMGISRDTALAFSLVGAALMVLLSLSGAVVWTARGSELGSS